MDDYQLALAPELGVSAEAFVAAWNESPEAQTLAQARLEQQQGAQYDPLLAGAAIAVLSGVGIHVVGSTLYDSIKEVVARLHGERAAHRRTTIVALERPDGTRLLVISDEEE